MAKSIVKQLEEAKVELEEAREQNEILRRKLDDERLIASKWLEQKNAKALYIITLKQELTDTYKLVATMAKKIFSYEEKFESVSAFIRKQNRDVPPSKKVEI